MSLFKGMKGQSFFRKLIVSYFAIVFLTVIIIGIFISSTTIGTLDNEIGKMGQDTLKQINYTIDKYIVKSVENISLYIVTSNLHLKELKESTTYNTLNVRDLYEDFSGLKNSYDFIQSIVVYIPGMQKVFTDNGTWDKENYPDQYKFYTSDIDNFKKLGTYKSWMNVKTIQDIYNGNKEIQIVPFVWGNIPIEAGDKEYYVIINVYWNKIVDNILSAQTSGNKGIMILSPDADILYQNSIFSTTYKNIEKKIINDFTKNKKIDSSFWMKNENLLVTSAASGSTHWIYVVAQPVQGVVKARQILIKTLITVCLIAIIIGFIISGFLAKWLNTPINNILNAIRRLSSGDDGFLDENEEISDDIKELSERISKYRGSIVDNLPAIKLNTLTSILEGRIKSIQEVNDKLGLLDVSFNSVYYTILVAEIDRYNELKEKLSAEDMEVLKLKLTESLETSLEKVVPCIACEYAVNRIVFLVNLKDAEMSIQILNEMIEKIAVDFQEQWHIEFSIAVGSIQDDIRNLNISYRNAETAMKYKYYSGSGSLLEYSKVMNYFINRFPFPADILNRFTDAVTRSDLEGAVFVIRELETYLKDSKLVYECYQKIISEFTSKFFETISDFAIQFEDITSEDLKLYKNTDGVTVMPDYIKWLISITTEIIGVLEKNKSDRYKKLIQEVLEYIHKNLDKDIRFDSLAEHVYISPNYLSRIFKLETGVTFTDYIMDARIEFAKNLLEQGDVKIQEISERIGYANPQYFIKKFKSKCGITPKQYQIECSKKKLTQ